MKRARSFGLLTLFGAGYLPFSASLASAIAAAAYVGLRHWTGRDWASLALLAVVALVAWYPAARNAAWVNDDPREAVVDEFIGMLACLVVGGSAWLPLVVGAFVAFRVLDIWKPGFFGWIDRNVHGAYGFVVDDVVIGVCVGVLVRVASLWVG